MPGASTRRPASPGAAEATAAMGPQPPPVAPKSGAAKVTVQAWQSPPKLVSESDDTSGYGHHVRCGSLDSVDSSSGSSTSSSNSHTRQLSNEGDYLAMRTTVKTPAPPPHNPLQFIKVNSPLYKKVRGMLIFCFTCFFCIPFLSRLYIHEYHLCDHPNSRTPLERTPRGSWINGFSLKM